MKLVSRPVLAAVLGALLALPAAAGDPAAIEIGRRQEVRSKLLDEKRTIWVHTPASYAGGARYPVLYLTDAEAQFEHTVGLADFLARNGLVPEMIVVGITNTDRTRDLTPTRAALERPGGGRFEFPTSGGGDRFLAFLETELIPWVDGRYRTEPCRLFAGHSFGGLLALHAFATRPALFRAVVAVSPTFPWDDGLPVREVRTLLESRSSLPSTLVVTLGDEGPDMAAGFDALRTVLESAKAADLRWTMRRLPGETHGSVVLRSHDLALRAIFDGWRPPLDPATGAPEGDLASLRRHYAALSGRFGYAVRMPEAVVNRLGYRLLGEGKVEEAIAAFRSNVETYPDSANVHDSLGEALAAAGRLEAARDSHARAVALAERHGDPNLGIFRVNLERARDALRSGSGARSSAAAP